MKKKFLPGVPYEDFLDEALKDAELAATYLNVAIEENDARQILRALRNVARAHGIRNIAESLHMQRESISRMLSKNGNPALTNFLGILNAAGLIVQVKVKRNKLKRAA